MVVGRYYNVNCAIINDSEDKSGGARNIYIPVIGHPHKDPQFSAPYLHYHVDGRFIGKQLSASTMVDKSGQTNVPVWLEEHPSSATKSIRYLGIVVMRRRCVRLTTGLKLHAPGNPYRDWYKSMIGKSCAGRKCPHRGTHMLERDGRLFCPLHNLQGDINKEVIIERIELESPN